MFTKGQKAYVASTDSRQNGFECTILSIGKKYITVSDPYGRKYRFDVENFWCEEWGIYRLYESELAWARWSEKYEKLRIIRINAHNIESILTDEEIDSIYKRIKEKYY